jgi:hypothetical protein
MAVVGDNRGSDRPVARRPDGSWSFEDARRRREQRQAGATVPAPPSGREPDEDLSALALSLADNLTVDGTPLSQLEIHRDLDGSHAPERSVGDAPTAEEIMRALETEQHAAATTSANGSLPRPRDPRSAHSPKRPSTRRGPHNRRLHPPRPWVIACTLIAAVGLLVVQLASGTGTNPGGHPRRAVAGGATAASGGLIASAMRRFLAAEHAVDLTLSRTRSPNSHGPRPRRPHARQTLLRVSTRSPSGSSSPSTSTASTNGTSASAGTTEQISQASSGSSSSSTSSGSGQPAPVTQSHTSPSSNSGSSSASPSKATLRSLVTGAGTCSCQ